MAMGSERVREIERSVVGLFATQKPFTNPDLTLPMLAEMLGVPTHHLSQVLNDRFGRTFHDFVNGARVEELKARLLSARFAAEKIVAIGIDCGFSSKSTLNANFKRHTGMTPTQFREEAERRVAHSDACTPRVT